MKKKKEFSKKLELNKEPISNLSGVRGGGDDNAFTSIFGCKKTKCENTCSVPIKSIEVSCNSCTGELCNTCVC